MNWLDSLWHLLVSSSSISTLIGIGALAVAIFEPKFMDAITDLRKWAIVVAVCAFGYSAVFTKGYEHGLSVKQTQWDAALKATEAEGVKARTDAQSAVDSGKLRNDRNDRDNP